MFCFYCFQSYTTQLWAKCNWRGRVVDNRVCAYLLKMNLYTIRSGTKAELESKKYNIGVGISLGNKWFTPENILELIKWSLVFTREKVVVYVADSIHALNIEVRNGRNPKKAIEIALEMGQNIIDQVKLLVDKEVYIADREKIVYAHWNDLVDDYYKSKVDYFYNLYKNDVEFRNYIIGLVRSHIKNEPRTFGDEAIDKLAYYILEELPEVLCRVDIAGISCDAYIYPFDGELTQFVEKLQKGLIFPEIKRAILDTEPKVFIEVR